MTAQCDDPRVAVWRALMHAHAALAAALDDALTAEYGLPLLSYELLAHLAEADHHRLRMQQLSERLPLTKSGLTRLVDRLEGAGLLRRLACPSDRRGTFAALTARGLILAQRAEEVQLRVLEERCAGALDRAELRALRSACEKIAATCRVAGPRSR